MRYAKCSWWHFTARARNVHLKLKTNTFCGSGKKVRLNLRGGISSERLKMYTKSYKLAHCFGSRVKIILNVLRERPKTFLWI